MVSFCDAFPPKRVWQVYPWDKQGKNAIPGVLSFARLSSSTSLIRFSSPLGKIFTLREQEGEVKSANQAKSHGSPVTVRWLLPTFELWRLHRSLCRHWKRAHAATCEAFGQFSCSGLTNPLASKHMFAKIRSLFWLWQNQWNATASRDYQNPCVIIWISSVLAVVVFLIFFNLNRFLRIVDSHPACLIFF